MSFYSFIFLLCLGKVSLGQHNSFAIFQPSQGLLSGRDFETSLKLPSREGWATEKVSLNVPQGIRLVKPESKPGWWLRWDGSTLLFEASSAGTAVYDAALEFQLHVAAGCEFPNASEATMAGGRHVLAWRTLQQLRASNGSTLDLHWESDAGESETTSPAPFLEVNSDRVCKVSASGPGMLWLGQHVPPAAQANPGLEEKVVGLEEDMAFDGHDAVLKPHDRRSGRRGVQAGMAFGRFNHELNAARVVPTAVAMPLWKVFGLLLLILMLLFTGTMLVGFVASAWARFVVSSSRESLLKDHIAKESRPREAQGEEACGLVEHHVLGKRARDRNDESRTL